MARPGRPERNRAARSFRQLRRFHHDINSNKVFGTPTHGTSHDNDLRAFRHPIIEVDHVLVQHADATGRYSLPDAPWLSGPMNAIERILSVLEEIKRAGAERIPCSPVHAFRPWLIAIRVTVNHVRRGCPVRPLFSVLNGRGAAEFQSGFADADAIPQGLAVLHHKIEKTFVRIDDNRTWRLCGAIVNQLSK